MLTHLDLFSGIGGFTLAAKLVGGIQTTQFVELDSDAAAVLRSRFPNVPIHSDIRDFSPRTGEFDIYSIGFPCTGTSGAGKRDGLSHPESSLWFEALRCIVTGRPQFVVIEQPEGFIHRGLRACLEGLRMAGYSWDNPVLIPARAVGSPQQKRNRLFIVSYPNEFKCQWEIIPTSWGGQIDQLVQEVRTPEQFPRFERSDSGIAARFPAELDSISIGVPRRSPQRHLRRRKLLGRAVMPQIAAIALRRVLYLSQLSVSNHQFF